MPGLLYLSVSQRKAQRRLKCQMAQHLPALSDLRADQRGCSISQSHSTLTEVAVLPGLYIKAVRLSAPSVRNNVWLLLGPGGLSSQNLLARAPLQSCSACSEAFLMAVALLSIVVIAQSHSPVLTAHAVMSDGRCSVAEDVPKPA